MITTPQMNLTVWDGPGDNFSHSTLAADLQAIDAHDHSFGKGARITTPSIAPGAITTPLLALSSVTSAILASNSVGTSNLQPNSVTATQVAVGAVTGGALADNSVDYPQLETNLIPIGSVIMWYRALGSASTPGGTWEIMDGRPWTAIINDLGLSSGNIPDMRGVFPRGADVNGIVAPGIGAGSGSNSIDLTHQHLVYGHTHDVGAHNHPITGDGDHYHTWVGGLDTWSRANSFDIGVTVRDSLGANRQNTFYSLYIKNINSSSIFGGTLDVDGPAHMDHGGLHNHGGATGQSGVITTTSSGSGTTPNLGVEPIVPQSVGLLFIMRVRDSATLSAATQ